MIKIPKLTKKISSFLTKEDGKITKQALIKGGVLLGFAILSMSSARAACPPAPPANGADHCNSLLMDYNSLLAKATHNHSYATHSSHGNHDEGGPCGW